MSQLTVVIPVGPYHTDIAQHAIDSVHSQTTPCEIIVSRDDAGKGAGWARNRGLEQVTTDFVTFLDADDTLDPRFAALGLGVLAHIAEATPNETRYAYTDWIGVHNAVHVAPDPCEAWINHTFHLVTTVLPTDRVRLIGGFDEAMQGVEDADFYVRLRLSGLCGVHINAPLVTYREGGQRSLSARTSGHEQMALQYMTHRYGGYTMGCCGDTARGPVSPTNEPLEGDVLAQALWNGNRQERGRVTGRLYPRTSSPKLMYVAADDVKASPMLWRAVNTPMEASNGVILQPAYTADRPWQETATALYGGGQPVVASQPIEYRPHVAGRSKAAVVAQAQEWTRVEGDLE